MKTLKIKQNLIMVILLQTIGKATTTIAVTKENELLSLLKNILISANTSIDEAGTIYKDLSAKEAEQEIETLDNMYKLLSGVFNMLFNELLPEQSQIIKPEYKKLIDNMEDIREGLELYMDKEFMQAIREVKNNDLSNFVKIA